MTKILLPIAITLLRRHYYRDSPLFEHANDANNETEKVIFQTYKRISHEANKQKKSTAHKQKR